ncbi:hypothetical protein ACF0H5_011903 [Mactra antiquata]
MKRNCYDHYFQMSQTVPTDTKQQVSSMPTFLGKKFNYLVNSNQDLVNLRKANIVFDFVVADTKCDIGTGLYELVNMNDYVDAFIGPACDSICLPAGLLAGKWNKAMISYACSSTELSNQNAYPTFARTTALYVEMTNFLIDFLNYYNWDRVVLIEGSESIWRETVGHFQIKMEEANIRAEIMSLPNEDPHEVLKKHLLHAAQEGRIFIISAHGLDVMFVLCAAESAGLLKGDHVFISIDFAYMSKNRVEDRPCDIEEDMQGLLDVTIQLDEQYFGYQTFVRDLVRKLNDTSGSEIGIHYGMIYDAVYLFAVGMDAVIGLGVDNITDGDQIIAQLRHHSFQGITGTVKIDSNGTRRTNFTMHNIYNNIYSTVAHGNSSLGGLYFEDGAIITWPGGSTEPPLGRPLCGWDGEFCDETSELVPVLAAVGVLVILLISLSTGMTIFLYRKKKFQERMESMSWKILYDDLHFKVVNGGSMHGSRGTMLSRRTKTSSEHRRSGSMDSAVSAGCQLFTNIVNYKGKLLAIKYINKPYIAVTKALITEINEIRNLSHRNVNPLIGACIDPMKSSILTFYCSKGSLQDVLENDNIKLDQIFKVSFASDIAKGMAYIHSSAVKSHGHLKSSNVFIDPHWTCKVGDIGMPVFRDGEKKSSESEIRDSYQMLWTAPEILRDNTIDARGTPKGDVYSFGIILQEIILRTGPYGYNNMEPTDILSRVMIKETPPYRPDVPAVECIPELDDIMRMSWEEVPLFRPTFANINESLKKFNNGRTTNLVDQMVHMMEKYADHLEELVQERTEQLEIEQKRTEDLLCRMLPRSIANDLKVGKLIAPETYESVTIFFSDIVGFTALASESTPVEVVNFLNDLYICFDTVIEDFDVYKVETIGDAYMVVSGLPERNGNRHAGEIATLALNILSEVTTFKIRHRPNKQLQTRIGIHSGPVCAGVVGLKMPRFCLFGDTVNYASRMESSGLALRIHVSPECKALLEELDGFHFECRGLISMKGKGEVKTYFLLGRQGFCKPLPDLSLAASKEEHTFK